MQLLLIDDNKDLSLSFFTADAMQRMDRDAITSINGNKILLLSLLKMFSLRLGRRRLVRDVTKSRNPRPRRVNHYKNIPPKSQRSPKPPIPPPPQCQSPQRTKPPNPQHMPKTCAQNSYNGSAPSPPPTPGAKPDATTSSSTLKSVSRTPQRPHRASTD